MFLVGGKRQQGRNEEEESWTEEEVTQQRFGKMGEWDCFLIKVS
jgi:hypothetical protein